MTLEQGKNEFIKIDPFQCVIVSTIEKINLPRFLIARWNLRLDLVYKGLLWLGAPQVDPGYCGNIFCPIFNLSNKEVELRLGERLALIDFVKTTNYNENECIQKFDRSKVKKTIWDYEFKLESALYKDRKRLDDIEQIVNDVKNEVNNKFQEFRDLLYKRIYTLSTIVFTVMAIIITALSILVSVSADTSIYVWNLVGLIFSVGAIIISFVALWRTRSKKKNIGT